MTMFSEGTVEASAVGVAAGLDRDAIVARVEGAIFDEHVAARLGVAAVVVGAVALDVDSAHGDVGQSTGFNSHIGELIIVTPSTRTFVQR